MTKPNKTVTVLAQSKVSVGGGIAPIVLNTAKVSTGGGIAPIVLNK
ncbi:hypothetical protein GCM10007939_02450 [Amylibacter marinus]|uniref:Uncharacterized protein n=1 Tax=Amylibacter marinus TaxID=1475483 RepID=A0ABQ5VS59_9RHOB|nr:hypothetical protein [Amylibacter marinus]GLQ33962.1 hypothetical protein GCM10007939_02450 [Amylibacter marinus]